MTDTVLSAWLYNSAIGATVGEARLLALIRAGGVRVHDETTVAWFRGAHQPRIGHHGAPLVTKTSALETLARAVFLTPEAEMSNDAHLGLLDPDLDRIGITPPFLDDLRDSVRPGSSALIVLSSDSAPDLVRLVVERGRARGDVELLHAQLEDDAPQALLALWGLSEGGSS
jgi:hypothetical protein